MAAPHPRPRSLRLCWVRADPETFHVCRDSSEKRLPSLALLSKDRPPGQGSERCLLGWFCSHARPERGPGAGPCAEDGGSGLEEGGHVVCAEQGGVTSRGEKLARMQLQLYEEDAAREVLTIIMLMISWPT